MPDLKKVYYNQRSLARLFIYRYVIKNKIPGKIPKIFFKKNHKNFISYDLSVVEKQNELEAALNQSKDSSYFLTCFSNFNTLMFYKDNLAYK